MTQSSQYNAYPAIPQCINQLEHFSPTPIASTSTTLLGDIDANYQSSSNLNDSLCFSPPTSPAGDHPLLFSSISTSPNTAATAVSASDTSRRVTHNQRKQDRIQYAHPLPILPNSPILLFQLQVIRLRPLPTIATLYPPPPVWKIGHYAHNLFESEVYNRKRLTTSVFGAGAGRSHLTVVTPNHGHQCRCQRCISGFSPSISQTPQVQSKRSARPHGARRIPNTDSNPKANQNQLLRGLDNWDAEDDRLEPLLEGLL
ncbi:hypothetical protein BDN72DRAFT_938331 [Pluteus cervinus]|uniref:Uncharacterized protein n=1 Tax=Pluteus cervinus TaxID=181527 RepID=A0ACD3B0S4_9AGAR|nr:hypothetical protein BDN72DRAFT_938331 [Pluteus cervinus]